MSQAKHRSTAGGRDDNPFRQPTDEEVFFQRDQERQEKEQTKQRLQYQRVHEKMTASASIGAAKKSRTMAGLEDASDSKSKKHGYLPDLSRQSEPQKEKENMADFIQKKREMGLIRMSLATKRMEIQKLENEAERAEKKIRQQEEQLEETTQKFEHFLKDNDMKAVEAMKHAELESKGKNEKTAEIKKLTAHNAAVMAEKTKFDEQLSACLRYKQDLDKLTPDAWFRDTLVKIRVREERERLTLAFDADAEEQAADVEAGEQDIEQIKEQNAQKVERLVSKFEGKVQEEVSGMPIDTEEQRSRREGVDMLRTVKGQLDNTDPDKVPMFFTEPDKILSIFQEIEENNLFLIQNCQEIEQALDELKAKYEESKQKMDRQVATLKSQIEVERQRIAVETSKKHALVQRRQQTEDKIGQEGLLKRIEDKVISIYKEWLGDDHSSKGTLMLMTEIETKLEELKKYIDEHVSPDMVSLLMKQRDKLRRDLLRQKKRDEEREKQQRRADQVLRRAFQSVKKRVGKPVMWRSKPDERKKEQTGPVQQEEEEDEEYFR
eukprot:TRINITY_DN36682_c0_g1_i1.p1 TRINITY_DN36682_c0_g1~~TRINITY_DN36682_c0_g1_i1.p1  ORF type:complete len:549 (+),score=281.87 TRINITY_DN36682_c0_g1_i1:58-1704(+)